MAHSQVQHAKNQSLAESQHHKSNQADLLSQSFKATLLNNYLRHQQDNFERRQQVLHHPKPNSYMRTNLMNSINDFQ
jgi:hypothetical protein